MKVAFCGKPGAGKTEAANYLCRQYGAECRAFATALREVAAMTASQYWRDAFGGWVEARLQPLYGVSKAWDLALALAEVMNCYEWQPGEKNRAYLQALGTAGRQVMPNVWVDLALQDVPEHCVFDDVRYVNEAETLQAEGFTLYRVTAPEDVRVARLLARDGSVDREALRNAMEQGLPELELPEVENSGTPEELYARLGQLV